MARGRTFVRILFLTLDKTSGIMGMLKSCARGPDGPPASPSLPNIRPFETGRFLSEPKLADCVERNLPRAAHRPAALRKVQSMPKAAYDADKAREFCARLADGVPLQAIVRTPDMPVMATISDWRGRKEFRTQFARARQQQAESLVDEIIEISSALRDAKATGAGDMALAKLRIDTLKWLVARATPAADDEPRKAEPAAKSERIRLVRVATGVPRADD
jgi:hypothetical protein